MKLQGPEVPESFTGNGHSIPHWAWGFLGIILGRLKKYVDKKLPLTGLTHDYEYHICRGMKGFLRKLKRVVFEVEAAEKLDAEITKRRKHADLNYKANVDIEGKTNGIPWAVRFVLKRRCFGALRRWGWTAIEGEGHPENAEALKELIEALEKEHETGV